ncbi:MAG: TIGR03013 family PEP-CTERM/XrtA system glycosyltransferase [Kordiimonadaceae bacterium]|nr:TIGR03013 family PEP-CTERM/XrtA system glycosyltransferase [Kordiimonadaceae bacterium]
MLYFIIWLALIVRFSQIGDPIPTMLEYSFEKIFYVITVYLVLLATGLYRLDICRDLKMTAARLSVSMVLAFFTISIVLYMFPDIVIWRSVAVYAIVLTYLFLIAGRFIFLNFVDHESIEKRVIVLGAGGRAKRVLESNNKATSNVKFIAFLKMSDNEVEIKDAINFSEIESLEKFVEQEACQEIVVANEERRGTLPVSDLLACKINGTYISEAASFIEQQIGALNLSMFNPSWMIFSDGFDNTKKRDLFLKRLFDIIASAILLIVSSPIILLTALMIKLSSVGPIFYRQERVGLMGQNFEVLKFRSMTVNAEEDGVPKWAQKDDVRVTLVGKFIRKTRIDEIPQIFNVFRGQMSFVGPRPERPYFVEKLVEKIPLYDKRNTVKPGITGWAQLSGTGKELLARALHSLSDRKQMPFIAINCGAIPENLIESELFGFEKGAFTGAIKQVKGKIEMAEGGTLFLDEIGDLPLPLQVKLLRFLQERVIERIGGRKEIPVDVRVVSATHQELENHVESGTFREDLFYRLSEIVVNIPDLKDRDGDALLLAQNFLKKFSDEFNKKANSFNKDAARAISSYDWPGNVRELENRIKRAVILSDSSKISIDDLEIDYSDDHGETLNLKEIREKYDKVAIVKALSLSNGNISETARLLGISRPTFYGLVKQYNLKLDK